MELNDLESFYKVLGVRSRLHILECLIKDTRTSAEIIAETSLSLNNTLFHLRVLREAGLVCQERRGALIYYGLINKSLIDILCATVKQARYSIK